MVWRGAFGIVLQYCGNSPGAYPTLIVMITATLGRSEMPVKPFITIPLCCYRQEFSCAVNSILPTSSHPVSFTQQKVDFIPTDWLYERNYPHLVPAWYPGGRSPSCVISVGSRSGRRRWRIGTTSAHTADRKPARNIWLLPTGKSSSCGSGEQHQADERVLPLALLGGSPFSDPSCHLSCYSGVYEKNERVSSTYPEGLDTLYYVQRGEHAPPEYPDEVREEVFRGEQRTGSVR